MYKLADLARSVLETERCSIFLHDEKKKELWTVLAHGVKEIRIPDNKGIAGYVFSTGEILNIKDAYSEPRFAREIDEKTGYRTKTILAVPLISRRGKTIGVFQAINKKGGFFSEEDENLLTHISAYASSAIENAILYEKLKAAHRDVIYRLSHATKFKDPETQNHIIRVGLFSAVIAESLGWDEEEVETIKLAAPMHDIGKVGIMDRILLSTEKLSGEDWEIMKKHTIFGYEILKGGDSHLLQVAAIIALEHHERWDGSGYPFGKRGEEISIYARITSISDVFDALTSSRPYKRAWELDKAVSYMVEQKGKQFDPKLVDIFVENIDRIKEIKEEYRDEDESTFIATPSSFFSR